MTRPLLLVLAAIAWPAGAHAAVLGVGTTGACTHTSVASAVSAALPGDTIRIAPGTWPANLGTIAKDLYFESGNASCTAFDSSAVVQLDGGGSRVMQLESSGRP